MTAIAGLTENFTGGAIGAVIAETNTVFTNVSGLGSSTFIVDPFDSSLRMMQVSTVANSRFHEMDFSPRELVWHVEPVDIGTPPDVNTTIMLGYGTSARVLSEKVYDVRIMAGTRTIQLRNAASAAIWTSAPLAASTKHHIWVMSRLGATASARRLRIMIFSGTNPIPQDSGELVSNTTQATMAHIVSGVLIDSTTVIRFGQFAGDDANGPTVVVPATVALGPDITGVEPGDTVTLTANTTGGSGSVIFTQTAGPTVALTGTGNTRSFVAPAYWAPGASAPSAPTLTFQATYGTATDTINVTPFVHTLWRKAGVSTWQPIYQRRRSS